MEYYGLMNEICISSLPSLSIIESLSTLQSSLIHPQVHIKPVGEFFESKGLHKSWIPSFVLVMEAKR